MTPLTDRTDPKALRIRADIENRLAHDFERSMLDAERENSRNMYNRLRLQATAMAEECLGLAAELEAAV